MILQYWFQGNILKISLLLDGSEDDYLHLPTCVCYSCALNIIKIFNLYAKTHNLILYFLCGIPVLFTSNKPDCFPLFLPLWATPLTLSDRTRQMSLQPDFLFWFGFPGSILSAWPEPGFGSQLSVSACAMCWSVFLPAVFIRVQNYSSKHAKIRLEISGGQFQK